jgi:cytoskeletal protein RodZ
VTDLSGALRAAREQAGLTVEEVSERTKIKVPFIQAIERADFERLPGEFFTRAFLRTYARELHLPPDEIVAAYDARTGRAPVAPAQPAAAERQAPVRVRFDEPSLALRSPHRAWPTVAVVAAVLAVVWAVNRQPPDAAVPAQPIGTSGVVEAAVPPEPAKAAVTKAPQTLKIEIRPARVMWVAAAADGKRVLYRLLQPGEVVKLEATDEFWFRMGDAGAFEYSVNGVPGKPLGASGEVREVQITRDSLASFHR